MLRHNIVIGQKIDPTKIERAKALRREMTAAEHALWQHLRANRLDGLHFRRQQVIAGLIVDFYCHSAALVVEVDGEIHEQRRETDAERDRILSARGLRVLHVRNEEIQVNLGSVLERIREWAGRPNPLAPFPAREGGANSPPRVGEGLGERS